MVLLNNCKVWCFQYLPAPIQIINKHNASNFKKIFGTSMNAKNAKLSPPDFMKSGSKFLEELQEAEQSISDPSHKIVSQKLVKLLMELSMQKRREIKFPELKNKPPIIDTKSFTSSYASLFTDSKKSYTLLQNYQPELSITNAELKRLYLYQLCLQNEYPFKAELPLGANEENFLKHTNEWESKLIENMPIRKKNLDFLMLKWSLKNKNQRKKDAKNAANSLEEESSEEEFRRSYNNALIPLFNPSAIQKWRFSRLISSNRFNQPLVFDMRFHQNLNKDTASFGRQLELSISENSSANSPFKIVLCNQNKKSEFFKNWTKGKSEEVIQSLTITRNGLDNLEPHVNFEDLIYLSPDAPKIMSEFNPHKTYVIGGLVDNLLQKQRTRTISLAEGIHAERLPLKRYLIWGGLNGKAELTVNCVFDVLLALKQTGCWINALSCVPYRLHRGLTDMGKELVDYDPDIIAQFDKGYHWKKKKEIKSPVVHLALDWKAFHRTSNYLGKR